jgi:hypothetical protein
VIRSASVSRTASTTCSADACAGRALGGFLVGAQEIPHHPRKRWGWRCPDLLFQVVSRVGESDSDLSGLSDELEQIRDGLRDRSVQDLGAG